MRRAGDGLSLLLAGGSGGVLVNCGRGNGVGEHRECTGMRNQWSARVLTGFSMVLSATDEGVHHILSIFGRADELMALKRFLRDFALLMGVSELAGGARIR